MFGRREADGANERAHRESAARQLAALGRKPKSDPLPSGPPFPDDLDHLWRWFLDLSRGRRAGGFGPANLAWADLRAWADLTGNRPEPWELDALMRLDAAWLTASLPKPAPATPAVRPKGGRHG